MSTFHRSATRRNKPSAPAKWVFENIGFDPDTTLDYGCGRGDDVDHFGIDGWDVNGTKWDLKNNKYTTILCSYVLNVIPSSWERGEVIRDIRGHLTEDGTAYITVRNDRDKLNGWTKLGTNQTFVDLKFPVVYKTSTYLIYEVKK